MLNTSDFILEKNYYIDIKEENKSKFINIFELAQTTQLPVIKDNKIIGILRLFSFVKVLEQNKEIREVIEKNITIAKKDKNISDYDYSNQKILPLIDDQELYIGFIKTDAIEKQLLKERYNGEIKYYRELQQEYQTIFESSYDGITVTDGEGMTLRINPAGEEIEGITSKDVQGKPLQELVKQGIYSESATLKALEKRASVTILQKVPSGKEIIATGTPIFKDGKIIRVITNSRDITKLNDLKRELTEAHQLAKKYHSELEHLRSEQMKTKNIVMNSTEMKKIVTLSTRVASVDSTVLIEGESGVGKGVLSKFIHNNSNRKNGPFIKIDCGSIPQTLLESELFGYEKGAFTGANKEGKIGLIELANGGTLFLDEIGEVPLNLQVKLLSVLQDRKIFRIGGKNAIPVDIRIIAATNRDLKKMVKQKTFREDLYYRLNVVPIFIPPLRERKNDIPSLAMRNLDKFNKKYIFQKWIEPDALEYLIHYDWPGNIRELENIIERLVVVTNSDTITVDNLPSTIKEYQKDRKEIFNDKDSLVFRETMEKFEKKLLLTVMKKANSIKEMSDILKLDRSNVRKKLKKHGIEKNFVC